MNKKSLNIAYCKNNIMKRGCKSIILFITIILSINLVVAVDWYEEESGTEAPLYAVAFANERVAWAVGGYGLGFSPTSVILKSIDGGVIWTPQDSPVSEHLQDVCFVDEDVGWAVGIGVIIYTDDGGDTWIEQSTPYDAIFDDVSCIDRNTAYVFGSVGRPFDTDSNVLKFVEGDWIELSSGVNVEWFSSSFINENIGYVVGGGGNIVKTTNGVDFEPLDRFERNEIPVGLSAIHCLTEDECWMADGGEFVYHTDDGWESFDEIDTGETVSSFGGIHVRDSDNVWVVGQSTLRHTNDGGDSWENDDTEITNSLGLLPVAFMRDVEFMGNVGLAVGDDGTILRYGQPTECPIIENPCDDVYAVTYDQVTGCIEAYYCVILPDRNRTVQVPVPESTCQDNYRECVEENYPDHADCDETYEFCDNIDEVLADVQKEYSERAFSYASEFKYFANLLNGEKINVYLSQEKGDDNIFGVEIGKGSVKTIEPYEKPTIAIYISENTLTAIIKSDDPKSAALNALSKGDIKIKGLKGKMFKVLLFKIGLKISLPFLK